MKLSRLLEQHRQFSLNTLPGCFGDGFLRNRNRIYRNIIEGATNAGFRFSDRPDALYGALPLSQLEFILKEKTIPYTDNVSAVEKVTRRLPDVAWDDLADGLKKNYVFHESCHACARQLRGPINPQAPGLSKIEDQRARTLQILVEESFANACELLAIADVDDPVHRIFYGLNSYTALVEERTNLKNAMSKIGPHVVFKFTLLAYLNSNFLRNRLDDRNFEQALSLATGRHGGPLAEPERKILKSLAKMALGLDPTFRKVTTGFHLRLNGLDAPTAELLNFDFLEFLGREPALGEYLDALANAALGKAI